MLWRLIAPQNQALSLLDRAADLGAVLEDVLQRVAGAAALRRDFRRRVRRLERLVGVEERGPTP